MPETLTATELQDWLKSALTKRDEAQAQNVKTLVGEAVAKFDTNLVELSKRVDDIDGALRKGAAKEFGDEVERGASGIADVISRDYGVDGMSEEKLEGFAEKFNLSAAVAGHARGWPRHLQRQHQGEWLLTQMSTEAFESGDMRHFQRAQSAEVDTAGGFAVPSVHMTNSLIPALEARVIAFALGAQTEDGFQGSPVEWPRIDATPDAQWSGEMESLDDQSFRMGQMKLTPHGLSCLIPLANRLLRLAPNMRNPIQGMMTRSLGRKLDLAILKGTGANGQPVGMTNTPGINSESWSSFDPGDASTIQNTSNLLDQMIGKIEDADAYEGRMGWAMSPAAKRALLRTKTTEGSPVFFNSKLVGSTQNGEAGAGTGRGPITGEFYGHAYATSTQLAGSTAADLILANWETVMVGYFAPVIIATSTEAGTAFQKNQTWIKAYTEVDVGIQHPAAICIANSFDSTAT